MSDLYQEFVKGRLGNSGVLNLRTIEIRFAYQRDEIVRKSYFLLSTNSNIIVHSTDFN